MKKYGAKETAARNKRLRDFEKITLQFLAFEYDVSQPNPACYKVENTPRGTLTIYPKGDKIQLANGGWIDRDIVNWLKKNIIKEKF